MFSIGNLVTLLVVVAMLFAYRHFDLRSRSLEKVKRYAGRVAKGLAQSVDRKAAEVQDLAIELQVNLKTGTELLKRVRAVAQGLADRAGEVERIEGRLRAHDATVTELADRTEAVAANLGQVETECAAVPALKEQLGAVRGETSSLETRIRSVAASVVDLDERVGGLLARREELREVHRELAQARELGTEVALQVTRLQAQRSHVETLEGDIGGLQQALEGLHPAVGELRDTVARLQRQVATLAAGSDRAEEALVALRRIDVVMAEAEQRTERLQVAREWLARTETRLSEIAAGAQEQLRLLEALLKADRGPAAPGNGSDALGRRETVLKLAGQGWSVPEIARATGLSRGEVELILEVSASAPRSLPEPRPPLADSRDGQPAASSFGAVPPAPVSGR
jgi:chromosome segregation ATPase